MMAARIGDWGRGLLFRPPAATSKAFREGKRPFGARLPCTIEDEALRHGPIHANSSVCPPTDGQNQSSVGDEVRGSARGAGKRVMLLNAPFEGATLPSHRSAGGT